MSQQKIRAQCNKNCTRPFTSYSLPGIPETVVDMTSITKQTVGKSSAVLARPGYKTNTPYKHREEGNTKQIPHTFAITNGKWWKDVSSFWECSRTSGHTLTSIVFKTFFFPLSFQSYKNLKLRHYYTLSLGERRPKEVSHHLLHHFSSWRNTFLSLGKVSSAGHLHSPAHPTQVPSLVPGSSRAMRQGRRIPDALKPSPHPYSLCLSP